MKPYSIKVESLLSLMLFFLEAIDQCNALFMCPCRPVEQRRDPEKIPWKSCSLINTNMQNVYWIMNMLEGEHVCLPYIVSIKVRLTLQRAWTLCYISGRACRRERGWKNVLHYVRGGRTLHNMSAYRCWRLPHSRSHWYVSTHRFNCVCLADISLLVRHNAGVKYTPLSIISALCSNIGL